MDSLGSTHVLETGLAPKNPAGTPTSPGGISATSVRRPNPTGPVETEEEGVDSGVAAEAALAAAAEEDSAGAETGEIEKTGMDVALGVVVEEEEALEEEGGEDSEEERCAEAGEETTGTAPIRRGFSILNYRSIRRKKRKRRPLALAPPALPRLQQPNIRVILPYTEERYPRQPLAEKTKTQFS